MWSWCNAVSIRFARTASIDDEHSLGFDCRNGNRASQEPYEGGYGVGLERYARNAKGHPGVVLKHMRQRTDELRTRLFEDFADLGDPERTISERQGNFCDVSAGSEFRFRS